MPAMVASLLLVLIFGCRPHSFGEAVITVDASKTYQVMSGWEATAQAGQDDSPAFANYRDQLLDKAVELGINRLRLECRSGLENPHDRWAENRGGKLTEKQFHDLRYEAVNDNDDPFVINWSGFQFSHLDYAIDNVVLPLKQRLASKGERLFVNVNYVDFGKSGFRQCRAASSH